MNKQELAEQILKSLAKRNGFSNWNEILNDYNKGVTSEETFKALILAAIVEAMDAPAKEGMKWVKASERLPEKGKQVFWNRHEEYPVWGRYSQDGGFHDLVTIDSSGEEEAEPINYDWEWLDESAPAKVETISDSPDWKQLRDKFFKECTETYEVGKGLNVLRKVSYNIAPHDLFEWFKRELSAKEAISVPPSLFLKQVVENDTIEALVMDYITFLELDKLGKLSENGTLDYENMNSVFPCIRKAKEMVNERQFFLLKDILTKRVSGEAISVPAQPKEQNPDNIKK